MCVNVEICGDSGKSVEQGPAYDSGAPMSHQKPERNWRRALGWIPGASGIGSVVLAALGHPVVLIIGVAVGTAVVMSVLVALGLLLRTSVYGDDVPREQSFRLMRFVTGRAEPPARDFATVPLDVAKEADAHDSHHLGASRAPAALESHALITTVGRVRQRTEHDRERFRSSRIRCNAL